MPAVALYPQPTQPLPPEQQPPPPAETLPPPAATAPPPLDAETPAPAPVSAPPPETGLPPGSRVLGESAEPAPTSGGALPPGSRALGESAPTEPDAPPAGGGVLGTLGGIATGAPQQAKETALGLPENLSEFTGIGRNKPRVYRPAPPGVAGETAESSGRAVEAAKQHLGEQLGAGHLGNVPGAAKDAVGAALAANMGEISPEGAGNRRALMDAAYYRLTHDGQWPAWAEQPQLVAPNGTALTPSFKANYETDPIITSILAADPETRANYIRAYEEGYTNPEEYVYGAGPDAMWHYFQDGRSGFQRGVADLTTAPLSTLGDVAATVLTAGGAKLATEGAEQAARGIGKAAAKQAAGKGLQIAGRGLDAAQTFGLSEAVPAAFKGAGALYRATPWVGKTSANAAARVARQEAFEAGTEVLSLREAAGGSGPEVSRITRPTARKDVYRVTLPEDAAGPAIDLAYHVDKKGTLDGVYDTVLPGPGDRYRALTPADAQAIYDAWGRLGNSDRQTLRQAAYPRLTRVETAPGEPFIDQGAERIYDPATGRLLADTGRVGTGSARQMADLRRTILSAGRPDQIITDYTQDWMKSLYAGTRHPLTRRLNAEHRLQLLEDVVKGLPADMQTPEIRAHLRQMRDLLPPDAPASIGTGLRWRGPVTGMGGGFTPLKPREQEWLRHMASLPEKAFRATGLDAGRVGKKGGIIFDRKPPPAAPAAYQNGYQTWLEMTDHRLGSPATARKAMAAFKSEINGLRASPGPAAQARQDAIAEALARKGLVPGAMGMSADQLVIGIEDALRRNRITFPPLPGANAAPPYGIFTPGSQDELWGMGLDDALRERLEHVVEISGKRETLGQRLFTHADETLTAAEIARRTVAGLPVDAADQRLLTKQLKSLTTRLPGRAALTAEELARLPAPELHRMAAALAATDVEIALGVRAPSGRMLTGLERSNLLGKLGVPLGEFLDKWRSMVLYSPFRGLQYPMMQALGNLLTLGIANREAIPYYLNPRQWRRSLAFLRDAETAHVPEAIRAADEWGLGRSENLGRVSRDEMGSRTAFNRETSHPLTKALGRIVAPQWLKDFADSWDQSLRQSLWLAAMTPAARRLERDLAPMAEDRFARAAARHGAPIGLTAAQARAAIDSLAAARPSRRFSQPELREALFQAAGGNAAANRKAVWDAADRTARDYHTELKKLSAVAHAEVNRVAFAGGETNGEEVLARLAVFTWWVSNATRLYATEAAGSPLQMALWARAIEHGRTKERAGESPTSSTFETFMQTPAGYTALYNPYSLLGTWLLGNTADPSDPRANLTALGRFLDGDFIGSNLTLNAVLGGALHSLGVLGQDARAPDLFATNRAEREIVDALNYANEHWVAFHQTAGGNPDLVPRPGFSAGMTNFLAQRLSGIIPGTQPVNEVDPNASAVAQLTYLMSEQVLRDNPDLDPGEQADADALRHAVELGMSDHDSPLYQEALGRYVDGQFAGLGADSEHGALAVLGAVTSRWVSPFSVSRQPTFRQESRARKGRDALRGAGDVPLTPETEATEADRLLGRLGVESAGQRDINLAADLAAGGDRRLQAIKTLSDSVRYDDAARLQERFADLGMTDLAIDGYHFTPQQLASLPGEDRRTLVNAWLNAAGYRGEMDRYYARKRDALRGDTAYANAEGLPSYAAQYPGGVDRFVDDTARINPNYRQFIEGTVLLGGQQVSLPSLRETDHAEWVKQVTRYDAARLAIAGVKDSRYSLAVDPKYAGVVAGLDTPVGAWYVAQQEADGKQDSDFTAALRDDYAQFETIAANMDKLDAAWGRPAGTTRALFVQNTLAGALDSDGDRQYALPYAEHQAMKAMGLSDYMPETARLKGYFAWQLQQSAGAPSDIDAYNAAYAARKSREDVPEIALRLATGQVPTLDADGNAPPPDPLGGLVARDGVISPGVRPGPATIGRQAVLAREPGGQQGTSVPPGLPVQTGQRMTGSDGSTWIWVSGPGGIGGWIDATALTPAA